MSDLPAPAKFARIVMDANNLPRQIAERLRAQIVTGELRPGERLPSERELAGSLNVSRGALREAARLLEAAGILEVRHGLGTFVTRADPQQRIAEAIAARGASIDPREMVELFELRGLIEPAAAAWAAERIDPQRAAELRAICDEAEALLRREPLDLTRLQTLDSRLHATIFEAGGNGVLVRIMADLMDLLAESRRFTMQLPGRPRESWREHRKLVDAIVRGHAKTAHRAMSSHLDRICASAPPAEGELQERKGPLSSKPCDIKP